MGIYVIERCHSCGSSLTGWIPNYYSIEEPFIICPSCKAVNDRSAKASEWQLMSLARKSAHLMLSLYWGFAYGSVFSVAIAAAMHYFPALGWNSVASKGILYFLIPGFAFGFAVSYFLLYRQIQKSNERLQDNHYRDFLTKHGFLKQ